MYWLAGQGLAAKWVLPVTVLCLLILVTIRMTRHFSLSVKGEINMENKQSRALSTIKASIADVIENISLNIAGGALLTNAFYMWI